jgi:hypothetical protein
MPSLTLVESAAEGIDAALLDAANEARTGHKYANIEIRGQARTGDAYAGDWKGNMGEAASHTYDGVMVGNGAKALMGNKYGGKDFWDD